MIRVDLHTHSVNSPDGTSSVRENAEAAKKSGLDAVGITDHDYLSGGPKKIGGVLILYGQEVSSRQGHILIYGVKKRFGKGIDARKLVQKVREMGGVSIAAHPYALRQYSLGDFAGEAGVDAVERFNGRNFTNNIRNILEKRRGVGGSDAHCAAEVGNAYTKMGGALEEGEILRCIREGEYEAVWNTKPSSVPLRYYMRMRRFLKI